MKTVLLLVSLLQALPFVRMDYEKLPDLPTPRCAHVVTTSGDDIFAFGGHTRGFVPVATAECFSGGKWQTLDMTYSHDGGFLTELPDGKWMIGGGNEKSFGIGQTFGVELFDPATRSFSPLTILDRPRAYASAAALPGGRVVVSGNWYKEDGIALYTPKEGFQGFKNATEERRSPYILPMEDGNALIFGGMDIHGDATKGWVDLLEGEPFSEPLLTEWTPFNFYVSVTPPGQIAPETWLVPAQSKTDGSTGILLVQGPSFSLLPTDIPIPRTGISACDIEYAMPLLLDTQRACAWLPGIDTGRRFYLTKLDYAPALKGEKARVTTYYAENPDGGFPKEMGFTLLPDGSIAALGGFLTDNFQPVGMAFLFRPLGEASPAGHSKALVLALLAAGLLAAAGVALFLSRRRNKAVEPEPSSSELLMQSIRTILEEKQLYKVHGLQVADLAKELGSNTTYISACINKETGATFNDLVNGYRIRHALGLLAENPSLPVVQVADISGFSSYSSFLRSFRQYTGKTPSEYLSAGHEP
jgi:AraC-like DNA-binding protein